ncbi:MAG: M24 family metallopeptidase [Pacificimonas sp.]|jgi:Xaa-Pro aminopeptidase|nr:M24 family metallopeptidase [Pacificimonas sp.]
MKRLVLALIALGLAVPTSAQVDTILPLRERAPLEDSILKERLDVVVPAEMRARGIDMWILIAREYAEDAVVRTMLDANSFAARRRTILVFHDPGEGEPVERFTVSRYDLADLFESAWAPEEQPDQWARLAEIVAERDPARIAVNISPQTAAADGLTKSQYDALMAALPDRYQARIIPAEELAIGWLETRTETELALYPSIVATAHELIAEAFSNAVITPGRTTADDVRWWLRQRVADLDMDVWFHPSVAIFRAGEADSLTGDTVIQPGDMLWTDFGITYLDLNTDTQQIAYVLRPGEADAPDGMKAAMAQMLRVGDIHTAAFEAGVSGNAVLSQILEQAAAEGIDATIYSHPLGYHGHGAGPAIGFWDNQQATPAGAYLVRPMTAWSVEYKIDAPVPEWGGQVVPFRSEEDGWFDGETFRYLDGRQTSFHLIGSE